MDRSQAETIALKALAFLAGDERRFGALCAQTGMDVSDLKARAGDAEFLAGVMDFLLTHEDWLIAFAAGEEIAPESLVKVRQALPGAAYTGSP